jgi:hypothetical protein
MQLPKFLTNIFTENDNSTFDLNRVLFAIAVISFTGMAWWAVIANKQTFAWLDAGAGFSAVLAGGGAGLALNRKNQASDPEPEVVPTK